MSKPIGVRIDTRQEGVWIKFKEFVENKYGKKHTVLGDELVRALQLYLDLYERAGRNKLELETHVIKKKAGEIEIKSLKEISYDLLNALISIKGYADELEEKVRDEETRKKIEKLRHIVMRAQKMLQDRIEDIG